MTEILPAVPSAPKHALDDRAIVDTLHCAVIATDAELRVVAWNRAAEHLYGWSKREVLGRSMRDVLLPAAALADGEDAVAAAKRAGIWSGEHSLLHRDGHVMRVEVTLQPVYDEAGALIGLVGVSEDVTEQRLEAQRTRQITSHLALALEAGGLGTWRWDIATGEALWDAKLEALFGLERGSFDGTFDAYTALLHPDDRDRVLAAVDEAVRHNASYVVEHRVIWPDGSIHWLQGKGQAITDDAGEVVGTMGCVADVTEQMHAAEELEAAITAALGAAERERLSAQRLEFIGQVNDTLARSATRDDVMRNITNLAVPVLGDFCAIYSLPTPDAKVPDTYFAHRDAGVDARLRDAHERMGFDPAVAGVVAHVMRSGEPVYLPRLDETVVGTLELSNTAREMLQELEFASAITVPLIKNRRVTGALQFLNAGTSRSYTAADLALAQAIASRVASTLENRRLGEQQREIAMTLQASLLPTMLPEIPGVDVAVRYWAAGEGTAVGGDFYDVFAVDDGRWAAVIGDVCGTGPAAAALTGLARHTIHASAWHGAAPEEVLAQLNTAVLRCGQRTFCTALYCELVPEPGGVRVSVAAGGHPLPIVRRSYGKCESFGEPGTLLGLFEDTRSSTTSMMLLPDDFVVLYTDGVTDLPPPHALAPEEVCQLIDEAVPTRATADELAAALGEALGSRVPFAERDDDIAVLVLRVARHA